MGYIKHRLCHVYLQIQVLCPADDSKSDCMSCVMPWRRNRWLVALNLALHCRLPHALAPLEVRALPAVQRAVLRGSHQRRTGGAGGRRGGDGAGEGEGRRSGRAGGRPETPHVRLPKRLVRAWVVSCAEEVVLRPTLQIHVGRSFAWVSSLAEDCPPACIHYAF